MENLNWNDSALRSFYLDDLDLKIVADISTNASAIFATSAVASSVVKYRT